MFTLFAILSLSVISSSGSSFWLNNLGDSKDTFTRTPKSYEEKWFSQQLDHFDHSNTQVWQQRYRVNTQFYTNGGPVLIMIGGEGPLSAYYIEQGLMIDIAKQHHGVMFHLEHRFYGISKPTVDTSVANLKYLSGDQGLADLATFTAWVKTNYKGAKVFMFGGSYPGDLSAWFQVRYRHLVDGVFSASAPYLAKVEFEEYAEAIEYATNAESPGCYDRFVQGIDQIQKMFPAQIAELKTKFRLCDDPTENKADLYSLMDNLVSPFAYTIQYGDQGRVTTFQNALEVCGNLTSVADPLEGLAKVNSLYLDGSGESCLKTYHGLLDTLRNTSWDSTSLSSRGWYWQTCTEYGWYQSYHGSKVTPGGTFLPLSYFLQLCADVYGPEYGKADYVEKNVARTNVAFGAYQIAVENAVIWNGNYDPWSRVSIQTPVSGRETYVFLVEKNSHCAVMRSASPSDTEQARAVRKQIMDIFDKWIKPTQSSAPLTLALNALLLMSSLLLTFVLL